LRRAELRVLHALRQFALTDDPCGSRLWLRSLYAHGVVQGAAGMHRDEGSVGAGVGVIPADNHAVGDGGLLESGLAGC
jgi:hypothetical protein